MWGGGLVGRVPGGGGVGMWGGGVEGGGGVEVWVVVVVWEKWCSSMRNMGKVIISRCIMCRGSIISMKTKREGGAGWSARGEVSTPFCGSPRPCARRWCGPGPSTMHRHRRG